MPLSIEHLRAHGLSAAAVSAWRSGGIEHLLPLQEKVLTEHGFLHGKSLLVCAPTSSGKTFVAEMAAVRQMERNRRVVFLVPTKALAEEKYRSFSTLYGPQGYRVAISTRERPEADKDILTGDYDLLVAVYEKMKAYLVARPEMLVGVALVVADEIQTLGEPGRGAMIDLLLTKIAKAPYGSQLIALSAVVGEDAPRLAAWLGCELIHHRERPVELREGVFDLSRGEFNYRDAGTGRTGTEPLAEPFTSDDCFPDAEDVDFRREAILSLARNLSEERGEQVLLFVPTRYMSRNWAHHLAGRASLEPARDVLNEMALYEDTHARDLLREVLGNGIAFHNADLSWDLRDLIERHFNSGDIRVLISTPTLAQGVNLRGRNVLHVPAMIATDRWTGRSTTVPLTRGRFRNQGGRSGRYRHEEGFGRSILVARNPQESARLMRDYVEGHAEPLTPHQKILFSLAPYGLIWDA